uniref:Uncharacterized protein n=1 Tax=Eutreptiella gymnastica TaxID=73025 RepID=A0A7S1I042_9EUGL
MATFGPFTVRECGDGTPPTPVGVSVCARVHAHPKIGPHLHQEGPQPCYPSSRTQPPCNPPMTALASAPGQTGKGHRRWHALGARRWVLRNPITPIAPGGSPPA